MHLAAYLLRDELDSARFLWKRLPTEAKADPELQAMWAVGTAMWRHKHAEVEHYLRRVEAERASQEEPDDESADRVRLAAPDVSSRVQSSSTS